MTGNQTHYDNWAADKFWAVPRQISELALLWAVAAGMQLWAGVHGEAALGRWAIMLAGAAAAWTAIVGVRYVTTKACARLVDELGDRLDGLGDGLGEDVAGDLVRRLELRRLEEQVRRLVPEQHHGPVRHL